MSGKPAVRSYRIWWPNRLRVPVPVRSDLRVPPSSTSRSRSSYGVAIGTSVSLRRMPTSRTDAMPSIQSISETVTTKDGTCPVTLHTPDGTGPWSAVVMYPDAGGVRPTFQEMAARLAGFGHAVLLPDVYYRNGDWEPFDMTTVFGSVTPDMIASDAAAFFDFLASRPEVKGDAFGVCGYCMGGRTSVIVAGRVPDRVAAAGSFHG